MNHSRFQEINVTRDALQATQDIIFNAMMTNIDKIDYESTLINSARIDTTQAVFSTIHRMAMAAIQEKDESWKLEPAIEVELDFND